MYGLIVRLFEEIPAIRMQALESYIVRMIGPFDLELIAEQFMMLQSYLLGLNVRSGVKRNHKDRFVSFEIHFPSHGGEKRAALHTIAGATTRT